MIFEMKKWLLLSAVLLAAGCSGDSISNLGGKKKEKSEKEEKEKSKDEIAREKALSEEDALAFIGEKCGGCHSKGEDLHSTWPIPEKDEITVEALQSMDSIATAYQAMINKITKAPLGHRPSPMPPSKIAGDDKDKMEGLLYWFQIAMPAVVQEAESTYGASDQFGSTISVNLNYQCDARATSYNYIYRLFNQALGRLPTPGELEDYINKDNTAAPVDDALRSKLAKLVTEGKLKDEFLEYGVKLFASKVGGSGAIDTNVDFGITEAVATDLRDEFYQLLIAQIEDKSYRDILTLDKVMVTSNTFQFYQGCADPGAGWGECNLDATRSNYFGTMGFLRSAPSSFLNNNNNYKRGGEIHAIMRGERLMAQTDGPEGAEADPVPECLTTNDQRVVLDDPADENGGTAPRGGGRGAKSR